MIFFPVSMGEFGDSINIGGAGFFEHHDFFSSFPDPKKKVVGSIFIAPKGPEENHQLTIP